MEVSLGVMVLDDVRDKLEDTERLIEGVRDGLGVSVAEELTVSDGVSVGEDVREGLPESECVLLIEAEGDSDTDTLGEGVLEDVCD